MTGIAIEPDGGERLERAHRSHRVLCELPELEMLELHFGPDFEGVDLHTHSDHADVFYVLEGEAEFTIDGRPYSLEPVYETSKHEDLFVIFKDLTSRKETYGAGRFLHTPLPVNGVVDLDFNRAYNPPCAFTDFATCPLAAKENQLPVRIAAGELRWDHPGHQEPPR